LRPPAAPARVRAARLPPRTVDGRGLVPDRVLRRLCARDGEPRAEALPRAGPRPARLRARQLALSPAAAAGCRRCRTARCLPGPRAGLLPGVARSRTAPRRPT